MLVSTQCVVRDREVERIPLSTIHRVAFGIPCRQDTLAQITMYAQEQLSFTHSSSKVLSPIRYPIQKMLAAKKVSCDTNRISVLSQLKASLAKKKILVLNARELHEYNFPLKLLQLLAKLSFFNSIFMCIQFVVLEWKTGLFYTRIDRDNR